MDGMVALKYKEYSVLNVNEYPPKNIEQFLLVLFIESRPYESKMSLTVELIF